MIYFCGDTHGDFRELNELLKETTKNDIIIICGDFGYWRKSKFKVGLGWFHDDIVNENSKEDALRILEAHEKYIPYIGQYSKPNKYHDAVEKLLNDLI